MAVIASGDRLILRDRLPSDVDSFIHWQTHGEWRLLDAPWEGVASSLTAEQEADLRSRFIQSCVEELSSPRKTAIIVTKANRLLGWVNRYDEDRAPDTWMVGIDIAEDDALNRGFGKEALSLWLDYLFSGSSVHRIGLDTWSLNPRMVRVAERLGFVPEGAQREVLRWNGQWLDFLHFGILRTEWEERKAKW